MNSAKGTKKRFLLTIFFLTYLISFAQETALVKPNYLKVGDSVAIVAPAGIVRDSIPINNAVQWLKSWGLHVKLGDNLFNNEHNFSGTDEERTSDLQNALDNKNIKAIWCARGGYGTGRIIDDLDFKTFLESPKWVIGFSDITVLHSHIHTLGVETMHAVMCTSQKNQNKEKLESTKTFKQALFGENISYEIPSSKFNKNGTTSGQLVGGNLTLLQNMAGTVSSIDTNGKILFIEEVGEYLYHIDRMLWGLKRNGYFNNCNGIIIGGMTKIKDNATPFGKSIEEIVLDVTKEFDFPIIFDFPAGHDDLNLALYLGRELKMKVGNKKSEIKFN
jgi:muramoyltetrapeptide carboxypeptidase